MSGGTHFQPQILLQLSRLARWCCGLARRQSLKRNGSHRSVRLRSNSCTPTTRFQKLRRVGVLEWIEFCRACRVDPLLLLRRLKSVRPHLESRRTLRRVRTIAASQSLRTASVITLTSLIFARRHARVCGVARREIQMPFAPLEVNAFRNSDCIAGSVDRVRSGQPL
jgi:hypothetical protein